MSTKRSAFSVFKSKDKSARSVSSDFAFDTNWDGNDDGESQIKSNGLKRQRYSFDDTTTPSKSPVKISKTESRLNSIRNSIRRKSKRESHHEVKLKQGTRDKSGSILSKLDQKSDWAENVSDLDSSTLEEKFLPEVRKQKREQNALCEDYDSSKENKRSSYIHEKPPIPNKKFKSSPARSSSSHHGSLTSLKSMTTVFSKSAEELFSWMISPIKCQQFFSEVWQKKPLFIKRRQPAYNNIWFSAEEFDSILHEREVMFTKNLDIAVYRNKQRETLNPEGRAYAPLVWKYFKEGCSIRLLNPQTFSKSVWELCSKLQEYFGCFVGSNVYLTPPGSQGFAPHFDDIEAFIIQLEGSKHWKLYAARDESEVLARHSSKNLSEDGLGIPILDTVLHPGDTLYMPRGVIHQGCTPSDSHSLHITVSVAQKNCWSDFLEKLLPFALQTAIEEDVDFRKALPIGYQNYLGVANSDRNCDDRKNFMNNVEKLMKKMLSYVSVDEAADELVLDQMEEYLPPSFTQDELACSIHGSGAFWNQTRSDVSGESQLHLDNEVKLLRQGIARIVPCEDQVKIFYSVTNSREYKATKLQSFVMPLENADIVEYYLNSENYVRIKDAPSDESKLKLNIAEKLYSRGIIRTRLPLNQASEL